MWWIVFISATPWCSQTKTEANHLGERMWVNSLSFKKLSIVYRIPGETVIYSCCSLSPPPSWTRVQKNVGRVSAVGSLRLEFFWSDLFQTIFPIGTMLVSYKSFFGRAAPIRGLSSLSVLNLNCGRVCADRLRQVRTWRLNGVSTQTHSWVLWSDAPFVCSSADVEWVVWAGGSVGLNTWYPGHVSPGTLSPLCTAWCLHLPINLICYVL